MRIADKLPEESRVKADVYLTWADGKVRLFEPGDMGGASAEVFRARFPAATMRLRAQGLRGRFVTRVRPEGVYVQWVEETA